MTCAGRTLGVSIGLLAAFVAGFVLGRVGKESGQIVAPAQQTHSVATSPDEFLQYASILSDVRPSAVRRSELLRAIALRRQRADPSSARAMWNVLREGIGALPASQADADQLTAACAQLVTFQDAIDEALMNCDTVADFEDAWNVRQEIDEELFQRRIAIAKTFQRAMPQLPQSSKAGSLVTVTKSLADFAKFLTDQHDSILLLVATTPGDASDTELNTAFAAEDSLRKVVRSTIGHEKDSIRAFRQRLFEGKSPQLEPAGSDDAKRDTIGRCEEWRVRLAELEDAMSTSELVSWRQLRRIVGGGGKSTGLSDGDASGTSELGESDGVASSQTLAELQAELRHIQVAAYNLWALRELEAAETVDSWDDRLARIDQSILEPAVSTIYSSVYTRRIDAVKDPEQRSRFVQRLLNSERTSLTAF